MDFVYDNAGKPYALKYDGTTYYYVLNLQGDVISIITHWGESYGSYTYDAWGNVLSVSGDIAYLNPIRYRGYYYDSETRLYYLQSRYYDPQVKRFINADVYASTGHGFIGYNMFAYCINNPVNQVDYDGTVDSAAVYTLIGALISALDGPSPVLDIVVSIWLVAVVTNPPTENLDSIAGSFDVDQDKTVANEAITKSPVTDVAESAVRKRTRQKAIYYGVDLYGGHWNYRTPAMTFNEAVAWVSANIAVGTYSNREAWGVYTEKNSDAYKLAMVFSTIGGPIRHKQKITKRGIKYGHYHPNNANKSIAKIHFWTAGVV